MKEKKSYRGLVGLAFGAALAALGIEAYAQLAAAVGFGKAERVENGYRDRAFIEAAQANPTSLDGRGPRILVLGDSMTYSPGIPRPALWTHLLEQKLARRHPGALVVNAGLPGANSTTLADHADLLIPLLNPDAVLVVYNYNDVYGSHERGADERAHDAARLDNRGEAGTAATTAQALRRSRALKILIARTNLQLKAWGYLFPGSQFHHLATRAYDQGYQGWTKTQLALDRIVQGSRSAGADVAVFVMTPFDSLDHDFFAEPRRVLGEFLQARDVSVAFGLNWFKGAKWSDYAVSPFDGHPNRKANRELAERMHEWLASLGIPTRSRNAAEAAP